jgi:ADP-ribose pyrophosphatase YjhB (NUDIX family)
VVREVFEESGFHTRVAKLLALYDREKQGHTPSFPYHVYKLFFLCEIIAGAPRPSAETSEIGFFGEDEFPDLSVSRVTEGQLRKFFVHHRNPGLKTDYD